MKRSDIAAVIFDLDGVVVHTAALHAEAWKTVFDDYLERRSAAEGETLSPFDLDLDYRRHVDGIPRLDGIRAFMASRDIVLDEGSTDDPPDADTVQGIGARKNAAFQRLLADKGPRPYPGTIAFVDRLKAAGIQVALISASRNCARVLDSAGLSDLFDVRVDGAATARLGLAGKPDPAVFLEAARQLNVAPEDAAIVEDAITGVTAGRAGEFGLVIGLDRTGHADDLRAAGADVVVDDLAALDMAILGRPGAGGGPLPNAFDCLNDIAACLKGRQAAVFLDYDGTLTPIADRPDMAVLDPVMRARLEKLAAACPTGIISGRGMDDIRHMVGIEDLYYGASHGFQMAGPGGWARDYEPAAAVPEIVRRVSDDLARRLAPVDGALIEAKSYSVAVHYRLVAPAEAPQVETTVDAVLADHPQLRKGLGKMVFELRPKIDWHKGKALATLVEALGLDRSATLPVYLGDDVTDEDAFRAIKGWGIGIVVLDQPRETWADYVVPDIDGVGRILDFITQKVRR